jgi:adenylate cyclase
VSSRAVVAGRSGTRSPARLGDDAALDDRGGGGGSRLLVVAAWTLAGVLPLVGFVSLLLRSRLDPRWMDQRLHFELFLSIGLGVMALAFAAGEAADRRRDARVFLLSVAFLATGGFLALHAIGSPGILVSKDLAGFEVAISVGLLVAAVFVAASAFVDLWPNGPA